MSTTSIVYIRVPEHLDKERRDEFIRVTIMVLYLYEAYILLKKLHDCVRVFYFYSDGFAQFTRFCICVLSVCNDVLRKIRFLNLFYYELKKSFFFQDNYVIKCFYWIKIHSWW